MSEPSKGVPPYQVVYSGRCRESIRQLLLRAAPLGRFAEIAERFRQIHRRLQWIPLDFGEPLRDHPHLGLQQLIGVLAPLVVSYGVDEARRIVYVTRRFSLLPNSGL